MTTRTRQSRAPRGIPAGGQFEATPAPEGDVELEPTAEERAAAFFPNTQAGIQARREAWILEYRSERAGELCESSGMRVQEQWTRGHRIRRHRSTRPGFVQGTYRCGRCGADVLVEAVWSASNQRVGYLWHFSDHEVPSI